VLEGNTSLRKGNTSLLKGNASLPKGNTSTLSKAAESQVLQATFLKQQVGCLLLLTHSCRQQHGFCMHWVHVGLRCCAFSIACVIACVIVCVIVCVIACARGTEQGSPCNVCGACLGQFGIPEGPQRGYPGALIFMRTALLRQRQVLCRQLVGQQQGPRHVQPVRNHLPPTGYHLPPIVYHLPPIGYHLPPLLVISL